MLSCINPVHIPMEVSTQHMSYVHDCTVWLGVCVKQPSNYLVKPTVLCTFMDCLFDFVTCYLPYGVFFDT